MKLIKLILGLCILALSLNSVFSAEFDYIERVADIRAYATDSYTDGVFYNGYWYISQEDTGTSGTNGDIYKFDSNWNYVSTIDVTNYPSSITYCNGYFYTSYDRSGSERVYRYSTSWSYINTITITGYAQGELACDGNYIYFRSYGYGEVARINLDLSGYSRISGFGNYYGMDYQSDKGLLYLLGNPVYARNVPDLSANTTLSNFNKVRSYYYDGYWWTFSSGYIDKYAGSPSLQLANFSIENYYNSDPSIFINITPKNTNSNINMTYNLYNSTGSLIDSSQFITNDNSGYLNLSSLDNGNYSIFVYALNDEVSLTTSNYTFTFDNLSPTINNSIPLTLDSYNFLDTYFSCNDTNLEYCKIYIDNLTKTSSENFTLTHNGNITYLIEAKDLAGNIETQNGTIYVNPNAYLRFYDTVRSQYVTSYNFGSYTANNTYVNIPIYDLGLGDHSLEFIGFGFEKAFFNFTFTNSSNINQTFNVSPALLAIKAYDETTLTALTSYDIQINNGNEIKNYNGINDLTLYSSNSSTLLGDLEISISKTNYTTRVYSITLDAYSVVNLNAYLLGSEDGGYVDFFIYDNNNKVVENALISIYQSINGSDTVIEQIYTDSAGYGGVFIDPTKTDQFFLVLKDGFVQQQYDIRPTTSEYKVYLKALTDVWEPWNNAVSHSITKHSTNTEPLNLTFTIVNQDNDFTLWGFKVYDETNTLIDTIQSTANSGGSLSYFDTGNHSKLRLNYYYQIGTNTESFSKTYYYHFISYNYSSLNVVDMGEDFVQTDEIPNEGKAVLFLIILIFVIAIPNKLPDLKGKGAGLFLGWAVVLYYSYIGGIHWGLSAMAIIGTALIHFDKKTEGRL